MLKIDQAITNRPRRNRKSSSIRSILSETSLCASDLIVPLFITEGEKQIQPISSMPGVHRFSLDTLLYEVQELWLLGLKAIALFPLIPQERKDRFGQESVNGENLICRAVQKIKAEFPELCVISDVALDPYTDHGHDGIVGEDGSVLNDETVQVLAEMALCHAQAGVDIVAPSDMMDGRVAAIRAYLDRNSYEDVSILSYAAKYASSLYGPFRDALQSSPKFGDKKTYQMDPANVREAIMEALLDQKEGADLLMIKPSTIYLDVLAKVKEATKQPVGAYHVSGEYSMIWAAHEKGWIDGMKVYYETLLGIKRAGADFIFTYGAKELLKSQQVFSDVRQSFPMS